MRSINLIILIILLSLIIYCFYNLNVTLNVLSYNYCSNLKMQSLKSNNDMLEKLLAQIQHLEVENQQLSLKLKKSEYSSEVSHLKTRQTKERTKDDALKLAKTTKELKEKVDSLTRALKQKQIQISELTQRLSAKLNMDDKERQHIIENFKRFQGRKPSSSQDHKTMELIQYYELQIEKRDGRIAKLEEEVRNGAGLTMALKRQLIEREKENDGLHGNGAQESTRVLQGDLERIKGEIDIGKLQKDVERKGIMIEKLRADLKDLRGKYEDLTKEYYQVFNELEENQKGGRKKQTVARRFEEDEEPQPSILPKKQPSSTSINSQDVSQTLSQYSQILSKLCSLHKVSSYDDLVCSAIASDMALQNLPKMQTYLTSIKQFLESNLQTRISFNDLEHHLKSLQILLDTSSIHKAIITTIFNELSLTEQTYLKQIREMKETNKTYLEDLKKMRFVKELGMARQIQEFVRFFGLEEGEQKAEGLKEQVMGFFEQLKGLHKFVGLANKLLDVEYDVPRSMEHVLQVLERHRALEGSLLREGGIGATSTSSSRKKMK